MIYLRVFVLVACAAILPYIHGTYFKHNDNNNVISNYPSNNFHNLNDHYNNIHHNKNNPHKTKNNNLNNYYNNTHNNYIYHIISDARHKKFQVRTFKRMKRQAPSAPQTYVIPADTRANTALFTTAPHLTTNTDLQYKIKNNSLVGINLYENKIIKDQDLLKINARNGVISTAKDLGPASFHSFELVVETLNDNAGVSNQPIIIKLVQSDWDQAVFTNQPTPIWVTIGEWNRPFDPIIGLQSRDGVLHSAHDVRYFIEHGDTSTFGVNEESGDVFINSRKQFTLDEVFTIVVSAQSQGTRLAARSAISAGSGVWIPAPAQPINIKVGSKPPQFHATPFVVNFFENATSGQRIGRVEATSFQNLPLSFSISPSSSFFSLDGNSGDVTLNSDLTYIKDSREYVHDVKVKESFSNFETSTKLIFKLHSANHPPTFAVPYYVKYNVSETTAVGTKLLDLLVREYDPGEMGRLEVTSSDNTFGVEENDGKISLTVVRPLNYESLTLQRYEFVVSAVDHGWPRMTGTTNIQIFVDNSNNKAPVFEPQNQIITIQEGAPRDLVVHYIQAYDPDGDNIRFTFNTEPLTAKYFSVDERTGKITLIKNIEPGINDLVYFNLSISITDDSACCPNQASTPHVTQGFIGINVYRVNTQPTFTSCRLYQPTVNENAEASDQPILMLSAEDNDKGPNGLLKFRIFGEEKNYFRVEQKPTGNEVNLFLTQKISRESAGVLKFNETFKYPIVVKAVDQGTPALSVNCFLFVTIVTINLKAPRFDYGEQNAHFYVTSANNGDRIARVFAFDTDFGADAVVSYSFYKDENSDFASCTALFTLESSSGWITWKGNAQAEMKTYMCEVRATDNGTPKMSSFSSVYIELTDNPQLRPPSWNPINNVDIDSYDFSIPENTALETVILMLSATISYQSNLEFFLPTESIDVFNGKGRFGSNSSSSDTNGQMSIVVKKALPESNLMPFYFLRCRAFVNSKVNPLTSIVSISRLKVKITDVNNQAPMFLGMDSNGVYTAAVTQFTKAGDFVVVVTAVDMDKSWPNNKISYSLQVSAGSNLFSVNSDTGEISVSSTATTATGNTIFDPNQRAFYEIVVVAQDGAPSAILNVNGPNMVQVKVQITVNGGVSTSPSFDRTFSTTITEILPRFSHVINATASLPTNIPNANLALTQYNIRGGNDGRVFAVDINNGSIYKVGALNADVKSFYRLNYTAFDGIRVIGPVFVNITVTRASFRPVLFDANVYPYVGPALTEKDPNSVGTTIVTVKTKAANNNQRPTYSLTDPVKYSVDQSGVVKLGQALSRDVPNGYAPQQVNVKAEAGGYSPGYALVTIPLTDINDNKPLFDPCCTSGFAKENTVGNAFKVKTFDADAGVNKEAVFSMVGTDDNFEVSPDGWIRTRKVLDFESKQKYSVRVKAVDKGSPPLSSEADISIYVSDVSEFPPSFPQASYDVTIDEELPVGSIVTSLKADDADPMDNITYSLLSTSNNNDVSFFYVDNLRVFDGSYEDNSARIISTGVLKMAKRLDYDVTKKSAYEFLMRAEDSVGRVATSVVKVTINDVNDNSPLVSPTMTTSTLTASDAVGKNVASFIASDPDSGVNGEFSFAIDHENSDPMFHFGIGPQNGQVTIVNQFNAETPSIMLLSVLAIDKGSTAMTGTATLNVTITDLQRPPPPANLDEYPVVIQPTAVKNSQIVCLNNNNNNNYKYELECTAGQNCEDFTIDQRGCLLANRNGYSRKQLDYSNYNIPVKISNKNNKNDNPDLVTRQNVRLVMQGTTDTSPQGGTKNVHVVNYVDADGGYSSIPLGNVYVEDVDDWDLHLKSFSLRSGSPYFSLNQDHKGKLFLRGDVMEGDHVSEVEVKDTSFPVVVSKVQVAVIIVNQTALNNAASMRIKGLNDVSDLLRTPVKSDKTRIDTIKDIITSSLPKNSKVDILSMGNFNYETTNGDNNNGDNTNRLVAKQISKDEAGREDLVDVLYAAKIGSKYYSPELLNAIVNAKKQEIEQKADVDILMAPVDMCRSEFYQCWEEGCVTHARNLANQPRLINTNQTSFAGPSIDFQQKCVGVVNPAGVVEKDGVVLCVDGFCLNSGKCVVSNTVAKCVCPGGYEGDRCEMTRVSFVGAGGFILLPALQQSLPLHLSLDLLIPPSSPSTLLILYSGPTQLPTQSSNLLISSYYDSQVKEFVQKDFLLLELSNGKPRLRVDFGDGEVKAELLAAGVKSLNDGKWHSLDVIIQHKSITLMMDNCKDAAIIENITSSNMDSSDCSVTVERTSQRFLINSGSFPLQLGGRMDTSNSYPPNWVKESLRGCVKNLKVNSQLYDMSIGEQRKYQSAESACGYEDCASCPSNSSCRVLGLPGTPSCQCPPGFQGSQCQTPTATRYYEANEFVKWMPTDSFIKQANSSQNWFSDSFQLMFRTRQPNGLLFTVQSFTNLERYVIQLIDGIPHFKFDLGSNDQVISLNKVKVNDGSWHWIRAERHGNKVELRLDDGVGAKYNSTFPTNNHRYIKLFSANILGELNYNEWTKETTSENSLEKTCISDVRYNGNLLALTTSDTSSLFSVMSQGGSDEGCDLSGACSGLNCVSGLVCVDLWQIAECRCEKFYPPAASDAVNPDCISTSCFNSPCLNRGTCTVVEGVVVCICPRGFSGLSCEVEDVNKGGSTGRNFNLVAAIVLPILLILLLICLLIFLLWWFCCRDRERGLLWDEPDKDIRENVIAYDDEGAGEEDNYAFDLGRLQRSNVETENVKKSIDFDAIAPTLTPSNKNQTPLSTLPGNYSNIGDFIGDRMKDVDADNLNDDSQTTFDFEGAGSEAGTLSTLASSQGDKDADLEWLENAGDGFGRLADMYGETGRV